jgi:hypothetical protein
MLKRCCRFLGIAIDNIFTDEIQPSQQASIKEVKTNFIPGSKVLEQASTLPAATEEKSEKLLFTDIEAPLILSPTANGGQALDQNDQQGQDQEQEEPVVDEIVTPRFEQRTYVGTEEGKAAYSMTMRNIGKDPNGNVSFDQLLFEVDWDNAGNANVLWFLEKVCGLDADFITTNPSTGEKFKRISATHLMNIITEVKKAWVNGNESLMLYRELWNLNTGKKDQRVLYNEAALKTPLQFAEMSPEDTVKLLSVPKAENIPALAPAAPAQEQVQEQPQQETTPIPGAPIAPEVTANTKSFELSPSATPPAPPLEQEAALAQKSALDFGVIPRNIDDGANVLEYIESRGITTEAKFNETLIRASSMLGATFTDLDDFSTNATTEQIMILCGLVKK